MSIMLCKECEKPLTKHQQKFCSCSCAAKFNNRNRSKQSREKQKTTLLKTLAKNPPPKKLCQIKYSPITGEVYNNQLKPISKNSLAHPSKFGTAKLLSEIFNFELGSNDTLKNLKKAKNVLKYHYFSENLSAKEIKDLYKIDYTDFGMFLKKCLGFKLRSVKKASRIHNSKKYKSETQKEKYWKECKFLFNIYAVEDKIPGFHLIEKFGWYHQVENPTGVVRDHMLSIYDAFRKNIDPYFIAHPANCEILTFKENNIKNRRSSITLEKLQEKLELF